MKDLKKKILELIPGGAHTYSRGYDQFPSNVPDLLERAKGAYVFRNNKKYLDYGMGLRSVNLGYSEKFINDGAIREIRKGNNLSLASLTEYKAAKLFTNTIKSADMVKFTKNGSTAVTAAIKLARAYTGKKIILSCAQHPFFSYDDWFIGSTVMSKGVPNEISNLTKKFNYNDIEDLKKKIVLYKNKIAAIILEPSTTCCPNTKEKANFCCSKAECTINFKKNNYLKDVERICKENKILFILDEMITGFRWHIKGAQHVYNVSPDLSTFGKAMANGFSIAAVSGKREIMELGSIDKKGERVFLASTTFGAEMSSLGAFQNTIEFIKKNNVIKKNATYGENFIKLFNEISLNFGVKKYLYAAGPAFSPYYVCKDFNENISLTFRTLLMQEMLKNKILFPSYISISYRHNEHTLSVTKKALIKAIEIYKKALKSGPNNYLNGKCIKPVFRKFN